MKKILGYAIWCNLLILSGHVYAYKEETHEKISENAFNASQIAKDSSILENLGIKSLSSEQKFPDSDNKPSALIDLVIHGANFEDSGDRSLNHFFNPVNGSPIPAGPFTNYTSPDWALEDRGGISAQEFSYKDARIYLYDALTKTSATDRDKKFGLTFQTLGQVMHHIQDMAQPQHVRNDAHCDAPKCWFVGKYNPSLYERYSYDVRSTLPFSGYAPAYPNADTTAFTTPRKFWYEGSKGRGLAEFTNLNFVSAGTNFDKPGLFQYPQFDVAKRTKMNIQDLCANRVPACPNPSLSGVMTFYGNDVTDRNTGQTTRNPYASSDSIFSADLTKRGMNPAFTLNRFNFELAHTFLIPRAVGYSAGLINYFFRGKLDFIPDPDNPGKYLIKNLGSEEMKGTFALYYDDKDGKRYPVADGTWKDLTIPALNNAQGLPNKSSPLTFTPPIDPAPNASGEYMLVFNGDMGEEKQGDGSIGAVTAKKIESKGTLLISRYVSSKSFQVSRSTDLGKSWSNGGGFGGSGLMTFVGDNTVLSSEALSIDAGVSWTQLSNDERSRAYRISVAPTGNHRLIGVGGSGTVTGGLKAFSVDKGITWGESEIIPVMNYIVRRPVYMGNNELTVGSYSYIGKTQCYFGVGLCDTYVQGLFNSKDNGSTWNLVNSDTTIGNRLLYIGKNKWANGILISDENGLPTLMSTRVTGKVPSRRIEFIASTDSGASWTTIGYPVGMEYVAPNWPSPWYYVYAGNKTIFAYFHDEAWPPSDYLYISKDSGTTWSLAGNLPLGTAYVGLFDMTFVGNNKTILDLD